MSTMPLLNNTGVNAGVAGFVVSTDPHNEIRTVEINDPSAAEVWTVTPTSANSTTYGITLAETGVEVTYTSDATATAAEITAGLTAAWNAEPGAYSFGKAVDGGTLITITGRHAGRAFTVTATTSPAKLALVNTVDAAEADDVEFGRAMISLAYAGYNRFGIKAKSTAFTARVGELVPTHAGGEEYLFSITVEGATHEFAVEAGADLAADCTAIAAAINNEMPAVSVVAVATATEVTLTAELAGKGFDVTVGSSSGGALAYSVTAGAGASGSLDDAFCGIAILSDSYWNGYYPGGTGGAVLIKGEIWVDSLETVSDRGAVYVELSASSDDRGKFYATASATRVRLDKSLAQWVRNEPSESNANIAAVRVSL